MARLARAVGAEPWDYADADTQRLTHGIHRYSGKFIPQIAARAIDLLSKPGDLVLDPYCGSGTTLVEAALLGRRALGVDLNPLAVLIARTKVSPIPARRLRRLSQRLREELCIEDGPTGPLFESMPWVAAGQDARLTDPWYTKWFQPHVLKSLVAIDIAIRAVGNDAERNVARVAFSDILRRSSNAHTGYPNVMFNKHAPAKPSPLRPFFSALDKVVEMVEQLERTGARWGDVGVVQGNAAALEIERNTVDAVVTHPPYIGSIPYAEYGVLSLTWLGADPKELDRALTGGRRQTSNVVARFETGYRDMLGETARVLKPGGYAFLMVGNPVVKGSLIDLADMTLRLAEAAGLRFAARAVRGGINRRANKMGDEHLLFFRKPLR